MERSGAYVVLFSGNEANALLWLPALVCVTFSTDTITEDHIYALPRTLEVIELYSSYNVTANLDRPDLAQLVPMLWKLHIPHKNLFPSCWSVHFLDDDEKEEDMFVLPQTLRYFVVGRRHSRLVEG